MYHFDVIDEPDINISDTPSYYQSTSSHNDVRKFLLWASYSVIHFLDSRYLLDTNVNYALIFALIITVSYIDLCIHILQLCTKSQMKR